LISQMRRSASPPEDAAAQQGARARARARAVSTWLQQPNGTDALLRMGHALRRARDGGAMRLQRSPPARQPVDPMHGRGRRSAAALGLRVQLAGRCQGADRPPLRLSA